MCPHQPPCPRADRPGRDAARTIACHAGQGWSLLCNGVIVFDDTGELLPDGRAVPPRRPSPSRCPPPPEMAGRFGSPRTGSGSPPGAIGCIRVQLTPVSWLTHLGGSDQDLFAERHSRYEDHDRLSR